MNEDRILATGRQPVSKPLRLSSFNHVINAAGCI